MYYESLCASVVLDPTQDFYDLISGKVQPVNSNYNEPLSLMILRFESLRLWDESESGERELLRLGAVLLRKLLQATQGLSILNLNDRMKKKRIQILGTRKEEEHPTTR